MNSKLFNLSRFYPGNIWFKRLGYLLLVYGIGLNCFIGTIQNKIIHNIEEKTNEIESSNILLAENKFPNLDFIKMEKGSTLHSVFEWGRRKAKELGYNNIITIDRINEIAEISNKVDTESKKIKDHISDIKKLLNLILTVIKITSNFVWISIIWALIWLFFDIKKGNAKNFTKACLLISVLFNIIIFYYLSNYLVL